MPIDFERDLSIDGARREMLLRTAALVSLAAGTGSAMAGSAPSWKLKSAKVLKQGQIATLDEGQFRDGFALEATASGDNSLGDLSNALFTLTLSVFTPSRKLGTQVPGHWYVQGNWTIEATGANKKDKKAPTRQRAGVVQGLLSADLTSDPIATPQNWKAALRIPSGRYSPVAAPGVVQRVRADGQLTFDKSFGGTLALLVK